MSELTKAQWELLEPLLPVYETEAGKAGRPRVDNRKILFCGYYAQVHPGRIYPDSTVRTRLAISVIRNGLKKGLSTRYCRLLPPILNATGNLI